MRSSRPWRALTIPIFAFLVLFAAGALTASPAIAATTYTVQSGDTLMSIGAKMGVADEKLSDWADDVVEINDLDSADSLRVGQKLTLPSNTPGGSSSASASGGSTARPTGNTSPHTVAIGDSLYSIAIDTHVLDSLLTRWIEEVVRINNLSSPDALTAGAKIQLPSFAGGGSTSSGGGSGAAGGGTSSATTYSVQSGDTLLGIAVKQGVPEADQYSYIDRVADLSGIDVDDVLEVGRLLTLPSTTKPTTAGSSSGSSSSTSSTSSGTASAASAPYKVKSGDSLYSIADELKVPVDKQGSWLRDVLRLNEMEDADKLTVGQELKVPGAYAPAGSSSSSSSSSASMQAATPPPPSSAASTATSSTGSSGGSTPASSGTPAAGSSSTSGTSTSTPSASGTPLVRPTVQGGSSCLYTVVKGDTLSSVAKKLGIPDNQRDAWMTYVSVLNNVNANGLPVGDGLRIPCS